MGLPTGEFHIGCSWEGARHDLGAHRCMFSGVNQFLRFRRSLLGLLDVLGLGEVLRDLGASQSASAPSTPPRVSARVPSSPLDTNVCSDYLPEIDTLYLF